MPLDGLRAWIGEVERKLGMRTRVFLVLAAIAIGGAGAAIYLALDTRDAAVSESDVRGLQEKLEAQIAGGGTTSGTDLAELEADLRALEAKVDALGGGDSGGGGGTPGGTGAGTNDATPPGTGSTTPGNDSAGDDGIATDGDAAQAAPEQVQELLEEAKEKSEAAQP